MLRLLALIVAGASAYSEPPAPRTGSRAGGRNFGAKAPRGPSAAAVAVGGVVASGVASSAAVAAHSVHGWAPVVAFVAGASAATVPALAFGAIRSTRRRTVESGAVRRRTTGAVARILPGDSDERLGEAAARAVEGRADNVAARAARAALPWVLPTVDAAVSGAAAASDNATSARVGAATEGVVARVLDDNAFLVVFAAVVLVGVADLSVYGIDRLLPA